MNSAKINVNKILTIFLLSHFAIWVLVPSITNDNLPLDTIEALAWGSNLDWGFNKHPPMSAFLVEIFYQMFGAQDWVYYLLSQICVIVSFFVVFKLAEDFFENKIRPVLAQHCYNCHSTQSKKLKAGLYLDNREQAFKGGESGPSIVPGKADSSLLYRAVLYKEESLEMPPKRKLPNVVIADFKKWIDMGAPWPKSNEPQIVKNDGIDFEKFPEIGKNPKPSNSS